MSLMETSAIKFAARPISAVLADMAVSAARGPTPEFLTILIGQQEVALRSAARRNDPERHTVFHDPELIRAQLDDMKKRLPVQRETWAAIRAAEARARREKIMAMYDPAVRRAYIEALNTSFGDRRPTTWQDDMSGVKNPDEIGSEE